MTIRVFVASATVTGEIIQLSLFKNKKLSDVQTKVCSQAPGQIPMDELHVTLGPNIALGIELPLPPDFIEFNETPELVTREDKTSVYLRATEATQAILNEYVRTIAIASGQEAIRDPSRVYHASLSNLNGDPLSSIAKIWNYEPFILPGFHSLNYRNQDE